MRLTGTRCRAIMADATLPWLLGMLVDLTLCQLTPVHAAYDAVVAIFAAALWPTPRLIQTPGTAAMYVKPTIPPDVVGEAIARAVAGRAWTGSPAELLTAIGAAATEAEREDRTWPRSPAALAAALRSTTDTLRTHGLRLFVMPDDLMIEPIPAMAIGPAPNGTRPSRKAA